VVVASRAVRESPRRRTRGGSPIGAWCRELRTLLKAGMTVVEALQTLSAEAAAHGDASPSQRLLAHLQQGLTLSQSMERSEGFPLLLIAGVKAGERSSGLVSALDEYLSYHDLMAALRSKLVSAAIYPLTVLCVGLAICGLLIVVVMPRFALLYAEVGNTKTAQLPWALQFSGWLAHNGVWMMAALAAIAAALVAYVVWQGPAKVWDRLTVAFPVLRRQSDLFMHAKLYRALALTLGGGHTLADGLHICQRLNLGGRLTQQLERARAGIERGERVSASFSEAGLTDETSRRLLLVAERTGAMTEILAVIGERHADRFQLIVTRAVRLAEPVLLLLVATLVGGLVLLMYLPIFEMASIVG
jgi:general secretion pathway protein F